LRKEFAMQLKEIGNSGVLCFNFSETKLSMLYKKAFLKWMDKNNIEITEKNYYHFYFVYALLMGPEAGSLIKNKNILLMTSNRPERNESLIKMLISTGANEVEFYETSHNRPMYDKIDLSKIKIKPDVVLIGAGVGAANILVQLKPLNCLCIDAGWFVDAFANIELAKKRPFCIHDEKWNEIFS